MNVKETLELSLKEAILSRNITRRDVVRLALSSIKQVEKDSGKDLSDSEVFSILQKEIKIREETMAEAKKAEREEMIPPLISEIEIIKDYLPKEMTEGELDLLINSIIQELDASTIKDMGRVMKEAISRSAGAASNERISLAVREILQAKT